MQFKLNGSYFETAPGNIGNLTIYFSVPQIITSFEFHNYQSSSMVGQYRVQTSIDGATYNDIMTYVTSGINNSKENIAIENPSAVKYFRLTPSPKGNYNASGSNGSILFVNSTLYGYTYSA